MTREQLLDAVLRLTDLMGEDLHGFLAEENLSPTRAHLLWVVHSGGPSKQRDLAQHLGYSARHVTSVVDDLTQLGLVTREAHPSDRRAVLVHLTARGSELLDRMEAGRRTLSEQLFGHLDQPAVGSLISQIQDIADRLERATQDAQKGNPDEVLDLG